MKFRLSILGLMTAGAAGLLASAALADPPGRVGRIGFLEGEVSFQPPEQDFWTDASVNFPVAESEAFWTGDTGRIELQIGRVDARLDNETEVDVATLRYGEMRLALPQGSLSLQLHGSPPGGVTVSTPAGDVLIPRAGFYRIDVGEPQADGSYPPAEVTVFEGEAEAPGPQGYMPVGPRQAAVLYAGADPQLQDAQDTAIDDWSRARARLERSAYNAGLPEAMTGADDLGRYGEFASTPEYGTVWFPRDTPPDWAPYRYGRWAYVAPWGYTWIDEQPWGFAPFHYGRWARIDGRWGWIPGQPAAEPVYAPALVAFVGGPGWSVNLDVGGGGALGWVPLAPDEVYRPPYEVSEDYVRRVNVTNVSATTINNVTVNRTVVVNNYRNAPAVTVVRADAMSRGAPVHAAIVPVSAEALARAPAAKPSIAAPPTPEARTGVAHREGGSTGVKTAAQPPARLQAVRAAVAAPATAAGKPPAISGARIAPPASRSANAPKALIAPAQVKNPTAQNRQTIAPVATQPSEPAVNPAQPKAPRAAKEKPSADTPPAVAKSPAVTEPSAPSAASSAKAKAARAAKEKPNAEGPPAVAKVPPASEPSAPPAADSAQAKAARAAKAKQRAEEAAKKRAAEQAAGQPPQP